MGKGWEHTEPWDSTKPSKTPTLTAQGSLTLFALQSHPGLQVVHLQLETFQGAVSIPGLALVGDEDYDDDKEEQTTPATDPDDGGQGEQAVRVDLQRPRGELKPSSLDLHHGGKKMDLESGSIHPEQTSPHASCAGNWGTTPIVGEGGCGKTQ